MYAVTALIPHGIGCQWSSKLLLLCVAEMQTQMEEERAVAAQEVDELTNYLAATKADLHAQHQLHKSHIFFFIETISRLVLHWYGHNPLFWGHGLAVFSAPCKSLITRPVTAAASIAGIKRSSSLH